MGRIVEGSSGGGPVAGRVARSAALVLAVAGWAPPDGDGPELSPPSEMPTAPRPAAPPPARPVAPPSRTGRAVLALPGITTPNARPPAPTSPGVIVSTPTASSMPSALSAAPAESLPGELPLDGPVEMLPPAPAGRPRPGPGSGRSPSLDPIPIDEFPPIGEPAPRPNPSNRRSPSPSTRPDPAPAPSPSTRRGRFFGLVPGPMAPARNAAPGRAVVEKDSDEPDADLPLRKRIEKQAREAVGDRARSIEVRLAGKSVAIQARGVRFYQKRAVRKSLESLPALSGLRSSIEVAD